ncbi:MAG TPA: MFS transporter [Bacteroidota bacterium]|nr:MFS transporter [Bacteroidota bacterium]
MTSNNRQFLPSLRSSLGMTGDVAMLSLTTFALSLGEELWQAYLPKYLTMLGASSIVVGAFASCKDLLDGLYQYPGGWANDRFGRNRALIIFTSIALIGYTVYVLSFHWAVVFVGLFFVMGWKAGAFPVTFAIIGDSLPEGKRSIAFSVQSILVRLPRVLGAPVGGVLIASLGILAGLRVAFGVSVLLTLLVLIAQRRRFRQNAPHTTPYRPASMKEIYRQMPVEQKRLLLAECFVRVGEGISLTFIVLYVIDILGFNPATYGLLYALQQGIAIAMYLPSGKLADLTGRRPLIALTFLFFALFPFAVQQATSLPLLVGAFVIGGLKEFGEPARKALIVDLSDPQQRGRAVGVYYTIRNLLMVPAGILGGFLWQISPSLTLQASAAVGLVGLVLFLSSSTPRKEHNRKD